MFLSKAGKGRFTAVGMAPSMNRGAGRESKRKYFPCSGPMATSFWTSSRVAISSAASLTGGLTNTPTAVFTPSFSVYSTRTSWPLAMDFSAASALAAGSGVTTFKVALSKRSTSVRSSTLIWKELFFSTRLSKWPRRLLAAVVWQVVQIFAAAGFGAGASAAGARAQAAPSARMRRVRDAIDSPWVKYDWSLWLFAHECRWIVTTVYGHHGGSFSPPREGMKIQA